LKSRGTDIVVSNLKSALTPKPFSASVVDRIKPLPHVAETASLLVDFVSVEKADLMIVSARQWGGFGWKNLKVVKGRLPKDANEKAVVLGTNAAEELGKKVGDKLQLETEELDVVGIVDGGAFVENGAVILSLPLYQEITGNQGKISVVDVGVTPGTTDQEIAKLIQDINAAVPEARAVTAGENIHDSQAYKIIHAMSWGTSLLAVLVGVLGVMNTMLMTVFERTQEICVLLAIGWKRMRIVRMILLESALLGFLGGIGGVALGLVGVKLLANAPVIHGLLEPDLSAELFFRGVLIAVVVGIFSGLYPAWRSSRLMPSQALHG
jgi:putative ABC transport system permease protein